MTSMGSPNIEYDKNWLASSNSDDQSRAGALTPSWLCRGGPSSRNVSYGFGVRKARDHCDTTWNSITTTYYRGQGCITIRKCPGEDISMTASQGYAQAEQLCLPARYLPYFGQHSATFSRCTASQDHYLKIRLCIERFQHAHSIRFVYFALTIVKHPLHNPRNIEHGDSKAHFAKRSGKSFCVRMCFTTYI